MLRISRLMIVSAGFFLPAAWSQQSYPFFSSSPASPLIVTATANSPFGQSSYCYWVVAVYPIGKSTPSTPSCVPNAIETSSVLVSWSAASGATSYDVLRTTTPILPSVTSSIAVATAVSGTTQTDSFGALSSYTISSTPSATANLYLDNTAYSTPQLRAVISGVGGTSAFNLSAGGVTSVFGRTGAVTAQTGDYSVSQVSNAVANNAANTGTSAMTLNMSATTQTSGSTAGIISLGVAGTDYSSGGPVIERWNPGNPNDAAVFNLAPGTGSFNGVKDPVYFFGWNALSGGTNQAVAGLASWYTASEYNFYTGGALTFTGTGLNDSTTSGYYTGTPSTTYCWQIDSTGTPDTFKWGTNAGCSNGATGVAITAANQTLNNGVLIKFAATTGHTLNDKWSVLENATVTEWYTHFEKPDGSGSFRPLYAAVDKGAFTGQVQMKGNIQFYNSSGSVTVQFEDTTGRIDLQNSQTLFQQTNNAKFLQGEASGGGAPQDLLYFDSSNKVQMPQPVNFQQGVSITGNSSISGTLNWTSPNAITGIGNIVPAAASTYRLGGTGNEWSELDTFNVGNPSNTMSLFTKGTSDMRFKGGATGATEFMRITPSGGLNLGGTTDIATGTLVAFGHISAGTRPTITGCGTISSQVGGAISGTFVTNAVSCTPALTALPTSLNGYECFIVDRTAATGTVIGSISSTTTSATFPTFTTVASDVLAFNCGVSF